MFITGPRLIKLKRLNLRLLFLLFVFTTFYPQAFAGDKLKIVAFGNSITSRRTNVDSVFADRLPYLLAKKGLQCQVINAGVGSSHSGRLEDNDFAKVRHGLDRFETDVLAHEPDIVIIGFGTNDAYIDGDNPEGASRIPLQKFERNLTTMIETLQAKGILVILRTPCPFAFPPERMYQDKRLYQYVKVVRGLSKRYKTGVSDNYKLFKDYKVKGESYEKLLPDGVHPNDKGHELIANSLVGEVLKIMKSKSRK